VKLKVAFVHLMEINVNKKLFEILINHYVNPVINLVKVVLVQKIITV